MHNTKLPIQDDYRRLYHDRSNRKLRDLAAGKHGRRLWVLASGLFLLSCVAKQDLSVRHGCRLSWPTMPEQLGRVNRISCDEAESKIAHSVHLSLD